MDKEYIAKIEFAPTFIGSELEKNMIVDLFVKVRNLFCNFVNPCYKKWNDEYRSEKHGSYDSYIREKMQVVIDVVNGQVEEMERFNTILRLELDDELNVVGVYKTFGKEYKMRAFLLQND